MVECSKASFFLNPTMHGSIQGSQECWREVNIMPVFAMIQVASCFLLILHIGTTKEKVSHYQDSKSIGGGEYQQCPPRKLVEVKIKPVFTMTSCELASWESPNCGCTAVVIHNYSADLSTAIIFCSKCKGVRFNFFYSVRERIQQ